jgi:hypothetical protein
MTQTILETEAAERRSAAERAIARYPALEPDEIAALVRYIRKDASALDRASIASNAGLQAQYRQLCRDHHFDRLRPVEVALVVAVLAAVVVVATVLYALSAG